MYDVPTRYVPDTVFALTTTSVPTALTIDFQPPVGVLLTSGALSVPFFGARPLFFDPEEDIVC